MSEFHSEKIDCLAVALCKAQAAMPPAIRDAENPHLRNRYADLSSVWDACRKPLTDNALAVVQLPRCESGMVYVRTMLIHASGQWVSCEMGVELADAKGLSTAQAVGSIVTYLRRYTLSAIAGVAPDDDDDGNAPGVRAAQTPKAPGRAENAPAPAATPVPVTLPEGVESWEGHACAVCAAVVAAENAARCRANGMWPPVCSLKCRQELEAAPPKEAK